MAKAAPALTPQRELECRTHLALRQRARTDLLWLCNKVLDYKDVGPIPHNTLTQSMQKFYGGSENIDPRSLRCNGYIPTVPLWVLTGPRFRLWLWPRGHLKTTILTIAHSIQWVLNYPDVRILISTAVAQQAQDMLREMKGKFQFNDAMRWLFPEFCPPENKAAEFGNQDSFIAPCRTRHAKEPTVSVSSIGKVIAGYHYEVLKFSDMVDKENVKTPAGIRDSIDHFNFCDPLLERCTIAPFHGWKDVEGTRYAIADLYGDILRKEDKRETKTWQVTIDSADPRDRADGKPLWPSRFPESELRRIEAEDEGQYCSQYRQRPIPESSALAKREDIVFFPRKALDVVPIQRWHATVDLHGMEQNVRNDYTVITVGGFDRDGRLYVVDIRRGRFNPFEVIAQIFDVWAKHKLHDIKIEKDAHARVLLPFLQRAAQKKGVFPVIVPIKRDTRIAKVSRIRGLNAWFKTGIIRFVDGEPWKADLLEEILNFPDPSIHDDILDTLADMMQNRDGGVEYDINPRAPEDQFPKPFVVHSRIRGFDEWGHPLFLGDEPEEVYAKVTGL